MHDPGLVEYTAPPICVFQNLFGMLWSLISESLWLFSETKRRTYLRLFLRVIILNRCSYISFILLNSVVLIQYVLRLSSGYLDNSTL